MSTSNNFWIPIIVLYASSALSFTVFSSLQGAIFFVVATAMILKCWKVAAIVAPFALPFSCHNAPYFDSSTSGAWSNVVKPQMGTAAVSTFVRNDDDGMFALRSLPAIATNVAALASVAFLFQVARPQWNWFNGVALVVTLGVLGALATTEKFLPFYLDGYHLLTQGGLLYAMLLLIPLPTTTKSTRIALALSLLLLWFDTEAFVCLLPAFYLFHHQHVDSFAVIGIGSTLVATLAAIQLAHPMTALACLVLVGLLDPSELREKWTGTSTGLALFVTLFVLWNPLALEAPIIPLISCGVLYGSLCRIRGSLVLPPPSAAFLAVCGLYILAVGTWDPWGSGSAGFNKMLYDLLKSLPKTGPYVDAIQMMEASGLLASILAFEVRVIWLVPAIALGSGNVYFIALTVPWLAMGVIQAASHSLHPYVAHPLRASYLRTLALQATGEFEALPSSGYVPHFEQTLFLGIAVVAVVVVCQRLGELQTQWNWKPTVLLLYTTLCVVGAENGAAFLLGVGIPPPVHVAVQHAVDLIVISLVWLASAKLTPGEVPPWWARGALAVIYMAAKIRVLNDYVTKY